MTCDNLNEFFQGRLAASDADRFREHLAMCATCQRDLHTDMQVEIALRAGLCTAGDGIDRCARPDGHEGVHASLGWARTWSSVVLLCLALVACTGDNNSGSPDLQRVNLGADGPLIEHRLSPLSGVNVGSGGFTVSGGMVSGLWSGQADGDQLAVPLTVRVGDRINQIDASVYGNTGVSVSMTLFYQEDAFHVGGQIASVASALQNALQTLSIVDPGYNGAPEDVTNRSYWLLFRMRRMHASEGAPFVGPIALTMSTN